MCKGSIWDAFRVMKKRALCVGINAYGNGSDLQGCVNDAKAWGAELERRRYNVTYLLDKDATKANILAQMKALRDQTKFGDRLVVTFSGHGTNVLDVHGDEPDGRDEAICPVDTFAGNLITDDELYQLFAEKHYGSHICFISDSCFSGTITRELTDRRKKTPRFLSPTKLFDEQTAGRIAAARPNVRATIRTAPVVTLSGCGTNEYSYDAHLGGKPCGAFSHYALQVLRALPYGSNYSEWYKAIRMALPSEDYPQTPELDAPGYQRAWRVLD